MVRIYKRSGTDIGMWVGAADGCWYDMGMKGDGWVVLPGYRLGVGLRGLCLQMLAMTVDFVMHPQAKGIGQG
jgi:hypothetical protein